MKNEERVFRIGDRVWYHGGDDREPIKDLIVEHIVYDEEWDEQELDAYEEDKGGKAMRRGASGLARFFSLQGRTPDLRDRVEQIEKRLEALEKEVRR